MTQNPSPQCIATLGHTPYQIPAKKEASDKNALLHKRMYCITHTQIARRYEKEVGRPVPIQPPAESHQFGNFRETLQWRH